MLSHVVTEHFFDGHALHGPTLLHLSEDGVVEAVEASTRTPDVHLVSPGLVDVQMNGFDDVDVATASREDLQRLDAALLDAGTTSWLGTIVTAPLPSMLETLQRLDAHLENMATGCVGLHVEGPFLGAAVGAHRPDWIVPIDLEWIESLPNSVKLITIAPEQQNTTQAIQLCTAKGIAVSLGHSRASRQQFHNAVNAGARMVTHLFNGMSGVHHRDDGVALSALTNDAVVAGLIADLVHVSPDAVSLAFTAKGRDSIALVSDSVAWNSEWAKRRGVTLRDGSPRLPDGTLAGSSTPLAECVRRSIVGCGVSLPDALRAATSTPARVLGYPQIGTVAIGQSASLVCFDESLHVSQTHRRLVFQRG